MDPSTPADEKERAMQQRIVTHMNADHRDSVPNIILSPLTTAS